MNQVIYFYSKIFQYLNDNIFWTNRVLLVSVLLLLALKLSGSKKTFEYVILFTLFFTLVVNIIRFNPVLEDLTIDYKLSIKSLSVPGFFYHNDFEGLKYITLPIANKKNNIKGVEYLYVSKSTIIEYSNSKEDWSFPNPNIVNSLSGLLKNFNSFSCTLEEATSDSFNLFIKDESNNHIYCFYTNE